LEAIIFDSNEVPVAPLIARLAGLVAVLAGLATASVLVPYWSSSTWLGRPATRLVFYLIAGGTTLVAIVIGARLLTSARGRSPSLPTPILWFGALLLLLCGAVQVLLFFVVPRAGSIEVGFTLGVGGAIAAVRLARRRDRSSADASDGA